MLANQTDPIPQRNRDRVPVQLYPRVGCVETIKLLGCDADLQGVKRIRLTAIVIGVVFLLVGGPVIAAAAVATLTPLAALARWLSSGQEAPPLTRTGRAESGAHVGAAQPSRRRRP